MNPSKNLSFSENEELPEDLFPKLRSLTIRPHNLAHHSEGDGSGVSMEDVSSELQVNLEDGLDQLAKMAADGRLWDVSDMNHWVNLSSIDPATYLSQIQPYDMQRYIKIFVNEVLKNHQYKQQFLKILTNWATNLRHPYHYERKIDIFAGTQALEAFFKEFQNHDELVAAANSLQMPLI